MADVSDGGQQATLVASTAAEQHQGSPSTGEGFVASTGLPADPGQLVPGKTKAAQRSSKIPSPGSLSNSPSQARKTKFPTDPLASTGSASALEKIRAAREAAAGRSTNPVDVASTISKAKEALAQARARAAAAGAGGSLNSRVSSRVIDGAVSDKPFTLYGKVELPAPRAPVQIHPPDAEEAARRKAWQAEKEALKQRRLQQEAAAREREAAAKAAAAAARAEEHRKRVEERKARYEAFKAREAEMLAKTEAAWQQYQQQRGRPPLFKQMEEDYLARQATEQEAKRAAYEAEVAAAKLATVSQLVSGEVVIKPAAGGLSPGRSRSPGALSRSPHGSGDHSQALLGRSRSPGRGGSLAASWSGGVGRHWAGGRGGPPKHLQLVERASSPLVLPADGSLPPGMKVIPTRLARQEANSQRQQEADEPGDQQASSSAAQPHQQQHKPADHIHSQQGQEEGEPAAKAVEQHAAVSKPTGKHASRRSSAQHSADHAAGHDDSPAAAAELTPEGSQDEPKLAGARSASHTRQHSAKAGEAQAGVGHHPGAAAADRLDDDEAADSAEGADEDTSTGLQVETQPGAEDGEGDDGSEVGEEDAGAGGAGEEHSEGEEQEAVAVEASEGPEAAAEGSECGGRAQDGGEHRRLSGLEAEVLEDEGGLEGEDEAGARSEGEQGQKGEEAEGEGSRRGSGGGEEVGDDIHS